MSAHTALVPGGRLGRYELLEELGRGGMGTVFRAIDESLDRIVAVKFLLPEFQADQHLGERFRREAKAMASVRHENVVQVFDFGTFGAALYFVMEHIEGESLDDRIERAAARGILLPIESAVWILMQVASGLGATAGSQTAPGGCRQAWHRTRERIRR